MAIVQSTGMRNARANATWNAGAGVSFNSGQLRIFGGASAPGPDAAEAGTLLVAIDLPADAMGAAAAGVVSKLGTWEGTAVATGTATYFRVIQNGGSTGASTTAVRFEGTVSAPGGGGDGILNNTSITTGQTVTINTATSTEPAS